MRNKQVKPAINFNYLFKNLPTVYVNLIDNSLMYQRR